MDKDPMNEGRISEQVYLAALAGLLHDVGKFSQRAGVEPDAASQAFGPEDHGRHGAHAKWSISFIHAAVPERWRAGLAPVLYHHRPQDRLSKVVALADRLSAAEREGSGESQDRQLMPIFCRLGAEGERPPPSAWPLAPLRLEDEVVFPGPPLGPKAEEQAYRALWEAFEAAARDLPDGDLPAYVEGLLYLLQRYTWCVPGAFYRSVPDVSLYDHSRTTAALAACLLDLDGPTLDDLLAGRRQEQPLTLLVGGDLSGVQDFIYTITARGAAKGLRGRSFYLQLLTEAVARFLLRGLGLPVTNLVYAGGGHFFLLAPLEAGPKLAELQAEVSRKLLEHHGGDLYLALGWVQVAARDFDREGFGQQWQAVVRAMNSAKRQRFVELHDAALLETGVFGPLGAGGGEEGECQVCHYDGPVEIENEGTDEERRLCALCRSLEDLGADLRDAACLLLGEVEPQPAPRAGYEAALRTFGLALGLVADDGHPRLRLPGDTRRATLLAMRDLPDLAGLARRAARDSGCPVSAGTRYTANVTPRKPDGEIATTDWLQEQARGVKRLGVLRMDMDDLGDLFHRGLQDATLSRVAALSSALALFFEGWVGELSRRVAGDGGLERIYTIYSGGDDLFIVGAWDALPGLAAAVRRDLGRFAAGNPAARLSGGLTLHAGKYPLYQAAAEAESALEKAKDLERPDGRTKDAFHFLDLTIPWEEFSAVEQEAESLVRLVGAKEGGGLEVSRGLLQVLLRLHAQWRVAVRKRGKPCWGPWMWLSAYYLRRLETRLDGRGKDEARAEIRRLHDRLAETGFAYIEVLGPAARWAELLTRKEDRA